MPIIGVFFGGTNFLSDLLGATVLADGYIQKFEKTFGGYILDRWGGGKG